MAREQIPANEGELNQAAKKALAEAGQNTDPKTLYCLQLIRWAVQSGERKRLNEHLLLFIELLEGWKPESVMNFLEKNKNGGFLSMLNGRNGHPQELAFSIIEYLDSCMLEKVEGYGEKKSPSLSLRPPAQHQRMPIFTPPKT